MAQDIRLDFTTSTNQPTLATEDVVDTDASTLSASVDLGDPGPIMLGFEFKFSVLTNADAFLFLQVAWSQDDTDFSDLENLDTIASIKCVASTSIKFVGAFLVKGQFVKFRYLNESGGVVDGDPTPPTVALTDITYDQA